MSKKEKSLHEKVKNFFGRRDTTPINFEGLRAVPYVVSPEVFKDIGSENNVSHRIKSLKDLYEHVYTKKLAEFHVEAICTHIQDLLNVNQSTETRHIVFQFYCGLIHGQFGNLTIMRSYFFRLILLHNLPDDLMPRFDMLKALSDNGKTITNFEEEMGPFLLNLFLDFVAVGKEAELLALFTNVIKFNAAYLDDYIIDGFVKQIKNLCSRSRKDEDVQESLNVFEAILCYSHLPKTALHSFICTLCITVNLENFVPCSWKQMRNLMGTYAGHSVIFYLCKMLQDLTNHPDPKIIRGAVYFIGMALWGSNKVLTLKVPPTAVIPSFLRAIDRNDKIIAYEIILALNKLVSECGDQLEYGLVWDAILEVTGKILLYPEFHTTSASSFCTKALQDFITLAAKHCPEDSHESLYKIIDQCSEFRNEQSIKQLILYKEKKLERFNSDFPSVFSELIEKFFRNESRAAIQLEVLKVVQRLRPKSLHCFEDDVVDQIILQHISHAVTIHDVAVRKEAVKLLIAMAETKSGPCFYEIMEIIEKIMRRMIECLKLGDTSTESCSDVVSGIEGLISIFKKKLFDVYSHHCIEVFNLLVLHMQQQYQNLLYGEEVIKIRKMILEFFFQIRANKRRQIGLLINNSLDYCLFLLCGSDDDKDPAGSVPSSPAPGSPSLVPSVSYLNFGQAYQVILTCLKEEKDWNVLELVFGELPILLRNKALILCGKCSVNALCSILYNLIHDKSGIPGILKNAPPRLTRTDVHCHIFPCVAALTSYHSSIDSHIQRLLNHCLQSGLVSRSAKICMEGLTLCLLEMQNSMLKLLPEMLLKLSKISATKIVAVPVLEFLSNLIRLPHLYVSFVEDQYMSIFAIALPYTNPFKFNQYTVALAHHVLSMWFLKCRIPFRRDFAKFIAKGLRSNLNVPRELPTQKDVENSSNEMSTDAILNLHTELMETGLDLMARFTFGMCTNVPQRSPIAEFLLEKGQKSSWLVGNKIVTITTSGCGTKSFKHGLCENCYTSSHEMTKSLETVDPIFMEPDAFDLGPEKFSSQRKRHCSAIQRTNTTISKDILSNINKSKDDITLHYKRNRDLDYSRRHHISCEPEAEFSTSTVSTDLESKEKEKINHHLCSCWCTSWAEVHIRRPTGSTSWMMRIQNQLFLPSAPPEVPLSVLSSLILPQQVVEEEEESEVGGMPSSESDILSLIESEKELSCEGAIEITSSQKSNTSMRRTNSSPDMNTGWLQQSLEAETKYPTLEKSVVPDQDQMELKQQSEKTTRKQDPNERMKPKNLKLDLSSINKNRSYSVRTDLSADREAIVSAPLEKRLYSHDVQQSASGSFRDRGHTISVMSPSRPTGSENSAKTPEVSHRSGMSPSFVFLQLFHNSSFGPATQKPILLQQTEINNRALNVLDHIPPYDTHKIGVVYVDQGQADNEVAILSNDFGSARYVAFLQGLGTMVKLSDIDPKKTYLGGLETNGEDGQLGLIWHDDVMQVVFHVATFMRNKESDEMRNEKKKHVANDSVMIVYNESEKDFEMSTIKGRVTNAWIIIQPEDFDCNIVSVKHRSEELIEMFGHTESYLVSDKSLPVFIRQMALHANLASLIISRNQQSSPKFAQVSNWLERLRAIKRLRSKVLEDLKKKNENFEFESPYDANDYDDFTDYV